MTEMIRRFGTLHAEKRADDSVDLRVDGHASVFDSPTLIGSKRFGYVETIARGAFAGRTDDDVRFLFNHGGVPMARTTNGTLTLTEDSVGLRSVAKLADIQEARDLHALIERGDVSQMSFAFTIAEDEWRTLPEDHDVYPGMEERTIKRVGQLYDVSAVTYPAYSEADIAVASDEEVSEVLVRHGRLPAREDEVISEARTAKAAEHKSLEIALHHKRYV